MIGIRVTNYWGESFYISSSIFPPLYMTAQWGHCVQFLSSLCAEIFIAGLSDFDLQMLCHRFTPNGQLDRLYIERAILSGQLKVHPEIQQTDLSLPENTTLPGTIGLAGDISSKKQREKRSLITIRSDIKITLRQIVDQERIETQTIEKQYQQKNTFGKSLAHVNHFATGLYTSGASFLTWMKDVNDVLSLNLRLLRIIQAAMAAENDNQGQRYQTFKQTLAESEKKELVEALGFDPANISVDKLKQVYELANLIYNDHLTRIILTQFVKDYADAQHSLEWSEFSGGAAFEVILTALLAIATGGIGAIASLGTKAKKISQLKKLGALFSELAEILKGLPKDNQLSLRKLKEIEDKKYRQLVIVHDTSSRKNVKPEYVNTTNNLESDTTVNVENASLKKNTKRPKYSNVKSMDPEYLAEELGMAKAWEPFGAEVEYLTPKKLEKFEVKVVNNKLVDINGVPIDSGNTKNGKVMFVMDPDGKIYSAEQRVMEFHHSSFLAGKDVASAGELMVFDGEILSHNRRSGHYKPSHEQHQQFISQLKENGIDLSNVPEEIVN